MVYPEYEKTKSRFYDSQRRFAQLLMEKERIFASTLPSGIRYDKDVVQVTPSDPMERFVGDLEDIEKKLSQVRDAVKDWEILLSVKERELRESKEIPDKVYSMRYLDKMSVGKIAYIISYSKRQVFRILKKIEKNINMSLNVTHMSL